MTDPAYQWPDIDWTLPRVIPHRPVEVHCSQPYRTDVGALLAPCCGRPVERTIPGALARKYGATFEPPCQCGGGA